MKDFAECLNRAIRRRTPPPTNVDEIDGSEGDWSHLYIDYTALKSSIRSSLLRRRRVNDLIQGSGRSRYILEEDFDRALRGGAVLAKVGTAPQSSDGFRYFLHGDTDMGGSGSYSLGSGTVHSVARVKWREINRRLSVIERSDFYRHLEAEIHKSEAFVEGRLGTLARCITRLKRELSDSGNDAMSHQSFGASSGGDNTSTNGWDEEETVGQHAIEVGEQIIELYAFVVINLITARQILIRFDAYVRNVRGLPLENWYMRNQYKEEKAKFGTNRVRKVRGSQSLADLFHLPWLQSLRVEYATDLRDFHVRRMRMRRGAEDVASIGEEGAGGGRLRLEAHSSVQYLAAFVRDLDAFNALLERTHLSMEAAADGRLNSRDQFVSVLRAYFLLGSTTSSLTFEPSFLKLRGKDLKREMETIAKWRETGRLSIASIDDDYAPRQPGMLEQLDPRNRVPLVLNLFSCLVCVMNAYIIEPSSAHYVSALGGNEALVGIMIGAKPLATLVTAVLYSMWTNYSFRQPILLAGVLACTGNLLYAAAYNYRSINIALVGRVLTGLGSSRLINRRYMADATPCELRTAASASFAGFHAVGAALGPFLAIMLDLVTFQFDIPKVGTVYFNGMTGPGYFMFLVWAVYLVMILIFFSEPNRVGIEEMKQKDSVAMSPVHSVTSIKTHPALIEMGSTRERGQSHDWQDVSTVGREQATKLDTAFSMSIYSYDEGESRPETTSWCCGCIAHITLPVIICCGLNFVMRFNLDTIVASTSIITKNRYNWKVKHVGTLHLVNGILVIPLSILAGRLSQSFEDRYLMIWMLAFAAFGSLVLVDFTDFVHDDNDTYNEDHWLSVGPPQYIVGSLVAFSSVECFESMIASVLSKVIPTALAVGTFNSGLLTTLVSTAGCACGDVFITLMGLISIRQLLNLLFVPAFLSTFMVFGTVWWYYDILI